MSGLQGISSLKDGKFVFNLMKITDVEKESGSLYHPTMKIRGLGNFKMLVVMNYRRTKMRN